MIKSMTGFGRGEYSDGKRNVTAEIKTVNHRYSDITVKMPKRYSFAEEPIKAVIREKLRRGKAEVSIVIENITEEDVTVKMSSAIAQQYIANLRELKETYDLDGSIDISLVASLPDVMKAVPDVANEEDVADVITQAVRIATENLDQMRTVEGEKLAEDLRARGELIRGIVKKIEVRAPLVAEEYKEKLQKRIQDLLGDAAVVPEERILTEAAIFADKANITEELVRLDSHMIQLKNILSGSEGPVGKKLDFLVQEMNREANTIGSKCTDVAVARIVVDIKAELEKIREQVQNVE